MTRYYLDTTAHLERHAGDRDRREAVKSRLGDDRHASSTHVLREWRHIVEGAAIDILNALSAGDNDASSLWARLSQGYGRAPGQRLRVLAMLSGQSLDLDTLRLRAEVFLRSGADELFRHRLDEVRDASECGLAREDASLDSHGRWTLRRMCKKTECVCVQPQLLEDRRDDVSAIGAALRNDARFRQMGRLAEKVMASQDPLERKGKNCWGAGGVGGDISIALECAPNETLLTTDASFDVIGPELGIQVERIAPTPPP